MEKMTQKDRVLQRMKDSGSITQQEAVVEIGCYRLAAVIYKLKKEGHEIKSENANGVNRYGDRVNFARYSLVS